MGIDITEIKEYIQKGNFGKPIVPTRSHNINVRLSSNFKKHDNYSNFNSNCENNKSIIKSKNLSLWNHDNLDFDDIVEIIRCICIEDKEKYFENYEERTHQLGNGTYGYTHYVVLKDVNANKSKNIGVDLGGLNCEQIIKVLHKILYKRKKIFGGRNK